MQCSTTELLAHGQQWCGTNATLYQLSPEVPNASNFGIRDPDCRWVAHRD
ncbi:MAG: hypothetical protein AAB402_02645 [Patescibacteria group bacterium]